MSAVNGRVSSGRFQVSCWSVVSCIWRHGRFWQSEAQSELLSKYYTIVQKLWRLRKVQSLSVVKLWERRLRAVLQKGNCSLGRKAGRNSEIFLLTGGESQPRLPGGTGRDGRRSERGNSLTCPGASISFRLSPIWPSRKVECPLFFPKSSTSTAEWWQGDRCLL
jgi:hypothetical protein